MSLIKALKNKLTKDKNSSSDKVVSLDSGSDAGAIFNPNGSDTALHIAYMFNTIPNFTTQNYFVTKEIENKSYYQKHVVERRRVAMRALSNVLTFFDSKYKYDYVSKTFNKEDEVLLVGNIVIPVLATIRDELEIFTHVMDRYIDRYEDHPGVNEYHNHTILERILGYDQHIFFYTSLYLHIDNLSKVIHRINHTSKTAVNSVTNFEIISKVRPAVALYIELFSTFDLLKMNKTNKKMIPVNKTLGQVELFNYEHVIEMLSQDEEFKACLYATMTEYRKCKK